MNAEVDCRQRWCARAEVRVQNGSHVWRPRRSARVLVLKVTLHGSQTYVGDRVGHHDVTALIGEGYMGQVYQATDTKLHRQVALKIL